MTVDTQADLVARLREQYAEQFKDEQAPEVIHNYERERFEAAAELERLRASNKQLREALLQARERFGYLALGGIGLTNGVDPRAGIKDIDAALKDGDKT